VAAAVSPAVRRLGAPAAALAAVGYLTLMLITGALPERRQIVRFEAAGVMELEPERIDRVRVSAGGTWAVFVREGEGWVSERDGEERLDEPHSADLDRAVKFMHTAKPVRVLEPEEIAGAEPGTFGLDRPRVQVELEEEGGTVLEAAFGRAGPDERLQYMRLEGRPQLYLMSGFVGETWAAVADVPTP
jgi:hypothetical protein